MSQMVQYDNVTICYEPEKEVARRSEGERWCFHCRARREFFQIIMAPIELYSYYGPRNLIKCGTCDTTDGDVGFGRIREWGED